MDVKKLSDEAEAFINRTIQKTEEKLGNVEKTEYGLHMELLINQVGKTKRWSEELITCLQMMIEPNLIARVHQKVFETDESQKQNEHDSLASLMLQAGNDLQASHFNLLGENLLICGSTEKKTAEAQRTFKGLLTLYLIDPLKNFLNGELKSLQEEINILEEKRLNYDAVRNKVRRRSTPTSESKLSQLEEDLAKHRVLFETQLQVVKHLLQGFDSTYTHHQNCLEKVFRAQHNYYDLCHQNTVQLLDAFHQI